MNRVIRTERTAVRFDVDLPVVIVGGGACGQIAALACARHNVACVILERDPIATGSTFMSSGFIPACNTYLQKQQDINDSADAMARDIMKKNRGEADPAIVRTLCAHSGSVIDWLAAEHAIPFELVDGFLYPGHRYPRMHCTPRRTGEELMACLRKATETADIPMICNAKAHTIYVDAQDFIFGIAYVRPDGQVETIGCRALILACNGYGGNPDLIRKYIPDMQGGLYYGHAGNQGDAVLWGEALGASLKDLGAFQGHGSLASPQQILISWAVMMQGGVQINAKGSRFSNETDGYSEQAARVIAQPGKIAWCLYDGRIHKNLMVFEDYRNAQDTGALKVFDGLDDMAAGLGMEIAALRDSFAEIDLSRREGRPDSFGRVFEVGQELTPPYYAVKVTGALFHTQGGLEIDPKGRVRKPDGKSFANLFAAGGAARGVSGASDYGYLSGNGLLSAVVMGKIAGSNAASGLSSPR